MAIKDYLEELAKTTGLDDESKGAILKALGNTKFAEELEKGVSRQSDYSRHMDELKTEKQKVESQIQTWRDWYNTAITKDAEREEELKTLRAKAGGGDGGGTGGGGNGGTGGGNFTKAELEALLAKERGSLIALTKDMGRVASEHAARFHEALDVDALEKIALEKGLTVRDAYKLYVEPRVKEQETKDIDERIRLAREEGIKEGMSKKGLPDESSTSRGHHVFFDRQKDPAKVGDERTRAAAFADAWTAAAVAGPTGQK